MEEGKPFLRGHVPGKPHQHKCRELSLASGTSGPRICKEVEVLALTASADRTSSQTLPVLFGIEGWGWRNVPVVFGRPLAMTRWLVSVLGHWSSSATPRCLTAPRNLLSSSLFSYSALKHWDSALSHHAAGLKRELCPGKRHSWRHSQAHVSHVTFSCWEQLRARACGSSEWSASGRGCSKDPWHCPRGPVTHRQESEQEDEPSCGQRPARCFCRSR